MKKDSRVFVAGHNGLVGSAIVRELKRAGYTDIITKSRDELDLADSQKVDEFFSKEKIEYVFLCAAKVGGIVANNTYRADFLLQNLLIQNAIISASHKNSIKKLLFLGSSCIYPKNAPQPIKESHLLTSELEYTNEPYSIAKIAGLKMCESFNIQYGTNFVSVMPTNLYGPNDNFHLQNSHVLPALIRKFYLAKMLQDGNFESINKNLQTSSMKQSQEILKSLGISSGSIKIWGSGNPRREFLHSDDMAEACVFVMENVDFDDLAKDQAQIKNTHINIGYGSDVSIKELATLIGDIAGFSGNIEFDTSKPDGTMQKLLDSSKINSLGWSAKIKLEDGVRRVFEEYASR